MPKSDKTNAFSSWLGRSSVTVIAVCMGVFLRVGLFGLHQYNAPNVTFYPSVMLAAMIGGFWPGVSATLISAFLVFCFFIPPVGHLTLKGNAEMVSLALFACIGVFMSSMAQLYQKMRLKTLNYEKELSIRDLEAHKMEFYRRTILAATDGKLLISEIGEIEKAAGPEIKSWKIGCDEDYKTVMYEVSELSCDAGMDEDRCYRFMGCVGEAVANVLKHAGSGQASLHRNGDKLSIVIRDSGPGIAAMSLPDVALKTGYSTAGTLGMGYKLMIRFADRILLATGPEGTIVSIEMNIPKPAESPTPILPSPFERE